MKNEMDTSRIDRRAFLQTGVAVSAVAVAGTALGSEGVASRAPRQHLALERFVVDRRFAAAVAAGEAARRDGVRVAEVDGDMSRLWYDDLDLSWRRSPMALAGMTGPEGLFVLETLAVDRGMRVVFRGWHAEAATVGPAHRLQGPAAVVAPIGSCLAAGATADFGESTYRALARCPAGRSAVEVAELGAAAARLAAEPDALVTWIIAPRGAATAVPAA